ncbi:MAG TPA: hypothetical protein ENK57_15205 [Polyangiaceae bacterium]|nr:hypothetical protein [Polyangiaceae bacterium]
MSLTRTVSLALALTVPAFAQGPKKHLLVYRFEPGAVMHYESVQNMTMTMVMGEQDIETKMTMAITTSTKVKSVKDGNGVLEQEITRVRAKMDNPMMSIDYDSDDEDSDPGMMQGLDEIAGGKTTMTLSEHGQVTKFEPSEDIADDLESSGVNLEQLMSQSIARLPEKPVAIGESWTTKQDLPLGQMGDTESEITYKLLAVDGNFIMVEQTMKIDASELELPGGMEVTEIKAKGQSTIDLRTGLPTEMTMTMEMAMTGQMDMSMQVKQTIKLVPAPKKKPAEAKEEHGEGK